METKSNFALSNTTQKKNYPGIYRVGIGKKHLNQISINYELVSTVSSVSTENILCK